MSTVGGTIPWGGDSGMNNSGERALTTSKHLFLFVPDY